MIRTKQTDTFGRLGPFKFYFAEPNPNYSEAFDAWEVEAYIDPPFCERDAYRDFYESRKTRTTYTIALSGLDVQYGPITRAKFGSFFPLFKPEASVPTSET